MPENTVFFKSGHPSRVRASFFGGYYLPVEAWGWLFALPLVQLLAERSSCPPESYSPPTAVKAAYEHDTKRVLARFPGSDPPAVSPLRPEPDAEPSGPCPALSRAVSAVGLGEAAQCNVWVFCRSAVSSPTKTPSSISPPPLLSLPHPCLFREIALCCDNRLPLARLIRALFSF